MASKIPKKTAEDVLLLSRNACCICCRRYVVVIHHIDMSNANHEIENLAVLCLICHSHAHQKGGSGRELTPDLVKKFRDDWIGKVSSIGKRDSEMFETMQIGDEGVSQRDEQPKSKPSDFTKINRHPLTFIESLPEFNATMQAKAQANRDTGITRKMLQASYDYIDALVEIVVTLSNSYSKEHLGNQSAHEYFSEFVSSRFKFHSFIAEPEGPEMRGRDVRFFVAFNVEADLDQTVVDMVDALVGDEKSFDFCSWKKRWRGDSGE